METDSREDDREAGRGVRSVMLEVGFALGGTTEHRDRSCGRIESSEGQGIAPITGKLLDTQDFRLQGKKRIN